MTCFNVSTWIVSLLALLCSCGQFASVATNDSDVQIEKAEGVLVPGLDSSVVKIDATGPHVTEKAETYLHRPQYGQSQVTVEDPETEDDRSEEVFIPVRQHYQGQPYSMKGNNPNSQVLVHVVSPGIRRKHDSSIPDLLAVLAPLAAIPLLGSLAVSSFTTMLALTGMGRRRKRDLGIHNTILSHLTTTTQGNQSLSLLDKLNLTNIQNMSHLSQLYPANESDSRVKSNTQSASFTRDLPIFQDIGAANKTTNAMSELFQLDIVQQYLRQSGKPDHNDQIIASYLACRGMFTSGNHCLERLACHYADMQNGRLRPLERDVAALIIYSLLRNSHIDNSFKRRLQRAALFGYDHTSPSDTSYEPSFVPVCDREFPCPKSEMP